MKKSKVNNFAKRLSGFSFSVLGVGGGVTFVQLPDEREIILKLLSQLADRRILFHHSCHVVHRDMISSLQRMRDNITAALEQIPESPAASQLIRMLRICHDFQSLLEAYYEDPLEQLQADFQIGLREFIKGLGECVSCLSIQYGIELKNVLVNIIPNGPA
jgi:hypothetical protein